MKMKLLKEIKLLPRAKFTKPKKEDGESRPRCGVKGCNRVLYRQTHDTGYQGPKKHEQGRKPLQRTKRGRPRLPENKRIQPVGWWCPSCKIFYYDSGDILPDSMTVIIRLS